MNKHMKKIFPYALSSLLIVCAFIVKLLTVGTETLNGYDIYFKYVMEEGAFTALLTSLAAVLPILIKENNLYKIIKDDTRSLLIAVKTGIVFVAVYVFALIVSLLLGAKDAVFTGIGYGTEGILGELRLYKPIVYIALFMVNMFIYGMTLNYFCSSLLVLTKNKAITVPICIMLNYIYLFIPTNFDASVFNIILYIIPYYTYSFIGKNVYVLQRVWEFVFIVAAAYIMRKISSLKPVQNERRSENE